MGCNECVGAVATTFKQLLLLNFRKFISTLSGCKFIKVNILHHIFDIERLMQTITFRRFKPANSTLRPKTKPLSTPLAHAASALGQGLDVRKPVNAGYGTHWTNR
jgi:hypothetical protein